MSTPSDVGKLEGMRALLARKEDKHIGCIKCGAMHAIIRVGSNGARFRCEHCSWDRREMAKEIATWLLTVIAFWPESWRKPSPSLALTLTPRLSARGGRQQRAEQKGRTTVNRKTRRRLKVGDTFWVRHLRSVTGEHFWLQTPDINMSDEETLKTCDLHGPFASDKEAQRDAELHILGAGCKVTHGGMWDPNWSKAQ